ncbi:hypothetical protein BZA05DRAFT_441464 [Tricharina praecox]|uniref:uncharacterized protein n=1 Tax=Tricharina praecox TaxID=43433 RepID=UPI00221F0DB2|nr:uncharacterized protein BZA05DRAFT_441464 [Tricharina praecox]KAI5856822.1 hypothetical protein BZA05DRAFT_441464 [Tricharina praecox]
MSSSLSKATILITGAGIAGPTLGLQILAHPLLAAGFHPLLLDRLPLPPAPSAFETGAPPYASGASPYASGASPYASGAGVVLSSNDLHSLYALGLKGDFNTISEEGMTMDIWRADSKNPARPGRYLNRLASPCWAKDVDSGLRTVERAKLQSLLVHKYISKGGETRWNANVVGVQQTSSGVDVLLEGGEKVAGDLVVGADGVWSSIRRALLNGDDERWKPEYQGSTALLGIVSRPDVKNYEQLAGKGRIVARIEYETVQLEGYKAQFSTGGYSAESSWEVLRKYENVWHPTYGTFGNVFKAAERMGRVVFWQRIWRENEIQGRNMVLVGDAARCMAHGQGANFSIEDVTVLADALLNNSATIDPSTNQKSFENALKEYASQCVPRSRKVAMQCYWSNMISQGDKWWSGWLRDFLTRKVKWTPIIESIVLPRSVDGA